MSSLDAHQEGGSASPAYPLRQNGGNDELVEVQRGQVPLHLPRGSLDVRQRKQSSTHLLEPPVLAK